MQCVVNKFFISLSPFSLVTTNNNSPNSPPKPPPPLHAFHTNTRRRRRTHKIYYHSSKAAHEDFYSESNVVSPKKTIIVLPPPNVRSITSTSNPFVKHCVKLRHSSSYRHSHGSVLVVGTIPIREICSFHEVVSDRPIIECLFVLDNSQIPEGLDDTVIRVVHVNSEVIRKLSGVQSVDSVEVIALVRIPSSFQVARNSLHDENCRTLFSFPHRILVLDGVQDPGNLGTLVRSATAFRWDGIFLLPGCCDPFNDKALRASRGASFQIPIVLGDWKHIGTLREEFQMKMLAGHPAGKSGQVVELSKEFADSVLDSPLCLFLGGEGAGLSELSRRACELVTIPMAGEFESLNVSVAGGIFMYMLQHHKSKLSL